MVIAGWRLAALLMLGPGESEASPPAPSIEAPIAAPSEGPIEGPAPPPASSEPGIELAPPPPEVEEEEPEPAESTAFVEEPSWPTPGTAPSDGAGMLVAGAILMPTTALATLALLSEARRPEDRIGLLVGGIGLELIGAAFLGAGIHRRVKLKRWTLAYRVVARPQGGGLIAAGSLAGAFGGTLIGVGSVALRRDYTAGGAAMLGIGIAGVGVIAPLGIYFGRQLRHEYEETGGWYRPALPTVQLAPRLIVTDTTFGFGVAGRF